MLFNSYEFIFEYLPLVLVGFFLLGHYGKRALAISFLGISSLVFYGWTDYRLVWLIFLSIIFNYLVGLYISRGNFRRAALWIGVVGNLALLGYFKYANFFSENVHALFGISLLNQPIYLPIGISFFTFTQIAFLVDVYRRVAHEYRFWQYLLFVTYFPHLIAGPILHHKEMIPQFSRPRIFSPQPSEIAIGIALFTIGLFKKVVIADGIAPDSSIVFAAAEHGVHLGIIESWLGATAYSMQIYFDFSGYSDMAIGLSRLFGIRLPINFDSPYKAIDFIDFWRRWHITLSRFLRDYLYISLGGNRKGYVRRHLNLLITMVLGGFWHGASWNFLFWGAMHGTFLAINHLWRDIAKFRGIRLLPEAFSATISRTVTFLLVVIAWVPFRAKTLTGTLAMWQGMAGLNGIVLPDSLLSPSHTLNLPGWLAENLHIVPVDDFVPHYASQTFGALLLLYLFCRLAPNSLDLVLRRRVLHRWRRIPALAKPGGWAFMPLLPIVLGLMLGYSLSILSGPSEFLYFRF